MAYYRCILCDRLFAFPPGHAALPAHVYPKGLLRWRPCASTVAVPLSAPAVAARSAR